jgi:glutamyl-Q tRNA(Asp) synthetase
MADEKVVTRFAPSPTGRLHLGHAFAALFAAAAARDAGGRFLIRIEDIDTSRARPDFERAIFEDLAWLGLKWEEPVRRQSAHMADYAEALDRLRTMDVVYPCFCTRAEIRAEIARSPSAPHGPDGPLYPGTCRGLSDDERDARQAEGQAFALRLDAAKALGAANEKTGHEGGSGITWHDADAGEHTVDTELFGDVVIARKETTTSYHLAVTVDDALQDVTLVTRGLDLMPTTHIHRLLQSLLDLRVPQYHHHRLIADEAGQRLATRDKAMALSALRDQGVTPEDVRRMVGML